MSSKKVHEYYLKNGLKLLTKEDRRSPIAVFQLFYKVGSSYEPNGLTGISHMLEHMMFRGSKNYNIKKFQQLITESGGYQNAFTSLDYTTYYQILSAELLPESFNFEADRMGNLLLRKSDFDKEIQVVKEERTLLIEDNPQRLALEKFNAIANLTTSYRNPVIGWMNDLQNITLNDVKEWYRSWYVANNAVCIVVGCIKSEKIYQLVKQYFGKLKSSNLPILKRQREDIAIGKRSILVGTKSSLPWLIMGFNVPTVSAAEKKWHPYALLLLAEIIAGGINSRLYRSLHQKNLVSKISYAYSPLLKINSTVTFYITPSLNSSLHEIKEKVLHEINIIRNEGPLKAELDNVKTQILADRIYQQDSILNQAQEIVDYEAIDLSWRHIDESYREIAKITPNKIKEVASKYLSLEGLILTEVEPTKL